MAPGGAPRGASGRRAKIPLPATAPAGGDERGAQPAQTPLPGTAAAGAPNHPPLPQRPLGATRGAPNRPGRRSQWRRPPPRQTNPRPEHRLAVVRTAARRPQRRERQNSAPGVGANPHGSAARHPPPWLRSQGAAPIWRAAQRAPANCVILAFSSHMTCGPRG